MTKGMRPPFLPLRPCISHLTLSFHAQESFAPLHLALWQTRDTQDVKVCWFFFEVHVSPNSARADMLVPDAESGASPRVLPPFAIPDQGCPCVRRTGSWRPAYENLPTPGHSFGAGR